MTIHTLAPVWKAKQDGKKPSAREIQAASGKTKRLFQIWDQLLLKHPSTYEETWQLLVPQVKQEDIICDMHEGTLGGHLGEAKTLSRLKERYYWPGHYADVQHWCATCPRCAARKSPTPRNRAPLSSIKVGEPLQLVAVDLLGPFPQSDDRNSYVMVVGDYFTRWMEAYAIKNQEAKTVAKTLTEELFFHFSPPNCIPTKGNSLSLN